MGLTQASVQRWAAAITTMGHKKETTGCPPTTRLSMTDNERKKVAPYRPTDSQHLHDEGNTICNRAFLSLFPQLTAEPCFLLMLLFIACCLSRVKVLAMHARFSCEQSCFFLFMPP